VTYRLLIRSQAELDIAAVAIWYNARATALGCSFVLAVDAAIAGISRSPLLYTRYHQEIRKINLRRFPYGVFYVVKDDLISVIAVKYLGLNPSPLKRELRKRS
jgi:hypothetical protein